MDFMLDITIPALPRPISYEKEVLLIGSCFTEHMGDRLRFYKFKVCQNPSGILFNPLSVADSLKAYASGRLYGENDLFYWNELWSSWSHHTRFSDTEKSRALEKINLEAEAASRSVREAGHILITLGSAFQYYLKESGLPVANNHRAPAQWFGKELLSVPVITDALAESIRCIKAINPGVAVILTISPVRHIRDGVIDNNRSKARLIEAAHVLCDTLRDVWYFPAYELVMDILRDYRFFDTDLVHPNYAATSYVWERFASSCLSAEAIKIMPRISDIMIARSHKPRFPDTAAHKKFLEEYARKTQDMQKEYPFLFFGEELAYFSFQPS